MPFSCRRIATVVLNWVAIFGSESPRWTRYLMVRIDPAGVGEPALGDLLAVGEPLAPPATATGCSPESRRRSG